MVTIKKFRSLPPPLSGEERRFTEDYPEPGSSSSSPRKGNGRNGFRYFNPTSSPFTENNNSNANNPKNHGSTVTSSSPSLPAASSSSTSPRKEILKIDSGDKSNIINNHDAYVNRKELTNQLVESASKQSIPTICISDSEDEEGANGAEDDAGDSNADEDEADGESVEQNDLEIIGERLDLWHVDNKDILINNPIHGRFYRTKIWCSRCRKEGNHPVKLCHLPKFKICHLCGNIGHLGHHCQNQHCKRCMDFHPSSNCSLNVRNFQCRICERYGHLDDRCPNHWRKFHSTTDPQIDPQVDGKIVRNSKRFCSVCGRTQHYSFECHLLASRQIEVSSPYDTRTGFGGDFHPTKGTKSPHKRSHSNPSSSQSTSQSSKRPLYFTIDTSSNPDLLAASSAKTVHSNGPKKSNNEVLDFIRLVSDDDEDDNVHNRDDQPSNSLHNGDVSNIGNPSRTKVKRKFKQKGTPSPQGNSRRGKKNKGAPDKPQGNNQHKPNKKVQRKQAIATSQHQKQQKQKVKQEKLQKQKAQQRKIDRKKRAQQKLKQQIQKRLQQMQAKHSKIVKTFE